MARERNSDTAAFEEAPVVDLEHIQETASRDNQQPDGAPEVPAETQTALFPSQEADDLKKRWELIQAGFVDEPRRAVQDADALVAAAMERLTDVFADERSNLERQLDRGDEVSTEDLRLGLQRYRSFFGRLLSV